MNIKYSIINATTKQENITNNKNKIKKLKGNYFANGNNLEEIMNLNFQPGKNILEDFNLLKEFVAKYIEK